MNLNHTTRPLRLVGEADFDSQVLRSTSAVLVAFSATWSNPCHVIEPVLREIAQACAGKVEVVKVNADDNPRLSLRYAVQYIPTLLYFQEGQMRGQLVGTASKEAILNLLFHDNSAARGDTSPSRGEDR